MSQMFSVLTRNRAAMALVTSMAICGSARAATSVVNFEDQPVSDPSSLTTLTVANGLATLNISDPNDPQAFGIQDLSALEIKGAGPLGARTIQPDLYDDPTPLNVDFSQPVSSFSMDFADASDQTDLLSLKAFSGLDGSGALIDSMSGTLISSLDQFAVKTLTVSGQGIRSVQFVGGPQGTDQAFYDNFSITSAGPPSAVPIPAAAKVFPLGVALACFAGWKLSRRSDGVRAG